MSCLIVIEGLDGSGKATQAALLAGYFEKRDKPVIKITFPDYESESSALVRMYLSGVLGGLDEVNVYAASSFYAVDRYASFVRSWKKPYESGHTIIADRYTTSNAVHQMTRLPETEWDTYLDWLADYEFCKMKLPRPDLVLYLDMPPEAAMALIDKRYEGDAAKKDIHEQSFAYLKKCRQAALYASKRLDWCIIRCGAGKSPFSVEEIAEKITMAVER